MKEGIFFYYLTEYMNIALYYFDVRFPERFIKNTDYYNSLMMMYRCAIREIQTKLEVLDDEFSVKYNRNPISSIKTRIKKPMSIYSKLQKLGYEFTETNIREQLNDVAGIRVICSFIDDIYTVANLLAEQDDIKILRIKDYILNPKSNGYRSYHMIVEIPVFFAEGKTPMRAEVQIRNHRYGFLGKPGTPAPLQKRTGKQQRPRTHQYGASGMRPHHHGCGQPDAEY